MKHEIVKTIRVKLHALTDGKEWLLPREVAAFQQSVENENAGLYSAIKRQSQKVRRQNNPRHERPPVLGNGGLSGSNRRSRSRNGW